MKVKVYFNIRSRRWSVLDPKTGKVINKTTGSLILEMTDVEFRVSEAGRQRVLRDKCKNVHSFAVGTLATSFPTLPGIKAPGPAGGMSTRYVDPLVPVSYNPYKGPTFVRTDTGAAVTHARYLLLNVIDGRQVVSAVL